MSAKNPTAKRMPWAEAVGLFGEPALKRGYSHQRVSNWRKGGVPGNVLIPLFLTKLRALRHAVLVMANVFAMGKDATTKDHRNAMHAAKIAMGGPKSGARPGA
jgi:hypothetical protein